MSTLKRPMGGRFHARTTSCRQYANLTAHPRSRSIYGDDTFLSRSCGSSAPFIALRLAVVYCITRSVLLLYTQLCAHRGHEATVAAATRFAVHALSHAAGHAQRQTDAHAEPAAESKVVVHMEERLPKSQGRISGSMWLTFSRCTVASQTFYFAGATAGSAIAQGAIVARYQNGFPLPHGWR